MCLEEDDLPLHPGRLLQERIINAYDLTQQKAAELLGISPMHIYFLLHGNRNLTHEMCCRIEAVFGQNAEEWAAIQSKYLMHNAAEKVKKMNLKPFSPK